MARVACNSKVCVYKIQAECYQMKIRNLRNSYVLDIATIEEKGNPQILWHTQLCAHKGQIHAILTFSLNSDGHIIGY